MKKFTNVAIILSVVLFFGIQGLGFGQLLLNEDFDYPAGDLITAHGWTAHSGAGAQPITVTNGGLMFPGYIGSGIGNAALLDNTGEDDNKTFTQQASGSVYAAFMVNITNNPTGYFFHFGLNPMTTTFRGKVFMDATNHFGVSVQNNTGTYASSTFTLGTTYLLVLKYEMIPGTNNDQVSLFVFDSAIPATEPAATIGPLADATQTDISPGSVGLRQFVASENLIVDGIRVGTSWSEVVSPPAVIPTLSQWGLIILGLTLLAFGTFYILGFKGTSA